MNDDLHQCAKALTFSRGSAVACEAVVADPNEMRAPQQFDNSCPLADTGT